MWHTVIMDEESPMAGNEVRAAAPVLRVHGPSRLAFAGTTLALVTLASLATAALVSESTSVAPGSVSPGLQALPPLVTGGGSSVVVDRAPGTFAPERLVVAPAVRTVVDALVGGAQGSSTLPPVVSGGAFPATGVLGGTAGAPGLVTPVVAPVVAPDLPPVTTPDTTPPVVSPAPVPVVAPAKAVQLSQRAAKKAARAAARSAGRTEHAKRPKPAKAERTSTTEQDQVEDRRFHEQAKQAKQAKRAKHPRS